ncbi:MAG: ATP-binding protein, partial [Chloroflexota bacterium]|nr:ATP-binding protein [Chloroflexota bacterium]
MTENIKDKWAPILEHKDLPEITDPHKRDVTRRLLENQELFLKEQSLSEAAPVNSAGAMPDTGGVAKWDPILIALVRRAMPQMIAYDVCGVQPMTGPTGLIFAMKAHYDTTSGDEALFDGALTDQSADNAPRAHTDVTTDTANPFDGTWATSGGVATATGEAMGDGTQPLNAMAFTIAKTTVTATTRALKAEYSTELAQDLKAVHGLDAETELANILSTEITAEINREVVRQIYFTAKKGAIAVQTTTASIFDLDTDSNGRWMVEKFKGLLFQIEREANGISLD